MVLHKKRCRKTTKEINTARRKFCKGVPSGKKWENGVLLMHTHSYVYDNQKNIVLLFLSIFSPLISFCFMPAPAPGQAGSATLLLMFRSSPDLKIKPGFKSHHQRKSPKFIHVFWWCQLYPDLFLYECAFHTYGTEEQWALWPLKRAKDGWKHLHLLSYIY